MLGESPLGPAVQGGKFGCRTDLFQDGEGAIGVGFYFRNVTEFVLFGVRGKNARTLRARLFAMLKLAGNQHFVDNFVDRTPDLGPA
jgi:hypothetical protein